MTTQLITMVILLILSGFFSATEVAFLSLTDPKVESMIKRKLPRAKRIKKLKQNPRRLLITILIGNNIVNIGASSLATVIMGSLFDSAVIGLTTGVMTLLVLIFGEIVPKSYAAEHNKKFAIFATPLIQLLQIIGFPLIILFEGLTNLVTGKQTEESVSEEEVRALAIAGAKQGTIEKEEGLMIERLFKFNDITAEDIMTPRVQMVAFEDSQSIDEAAEVVEKNPFTRYPVIKKTPDNVVGFVHSRDILLAFHKEKEHASIKKIVHPIVTVPKQMPIDDVMREFQKKRVHMAVVVDEFGGTEGVVTFEDVIEELVGEITDEHDVADNLMHRVDKYTIIVAGDSTLRDINGFMATAIEGNPLDTIAEIILDAIQKLPRKNTDVELANTVCTILEVKKKRIQKVQIRKTV